MSLYRDILKHRIDLYSLHAACEARSWLKLPDAETEKFISGLQNCTCIDVSNLDLNDLSLVPEFGYEFAKPPWHAAWIEDRFMNPILGIPGIHAVVVKDRPDLKGIDGNEETCLQILTVVSRRDSRSAYYLPPFTVHLDHFGNCMLEKSGGRMIRVIQKAVKTIRDAELDGWLQSTATGHTNWNGIAEEFAMSANGALYTYSLANAKNVSVRRVGPAIGKRKASRRGITWHKLFIKVPGEFSGGQSGWSELGEMTRAHLVRGHFATFTEDAPAFGKPWGVGRFWIPPHVRGDETKGVVEKDYVLEKAQ